MDNNRIFRDMDSSIDWNTGAFIIFTHLLFLVFVPWYLMVTTPSLGLILASFAIYVLCGISVTLGYHRFFSHRAFSLHKSVQALTLLFGALAPASSVYRWSYDHRLHHQFVDTDRDPYNAKKGFWHSHLLWMFKKRKQLDARLVADLGRNRLVMFQERFYIPLMIASNVLVVLGLGLLFKDFFGAFVIGVLCRLIIIHHTMWSINSWAHLLGTKPYSKKHTAVNNWFLSFFTFGEGYHNFHHTFCTDYRNGVRWYEFDVTKYSIWLLSKICLASDLRRMNSLTIRKAMLSEDRRYLLERIRSSSYAKEFEEKVHLLSERLHAHMTELYKRRAEYLEHKRSKAPKDRLVALKASIKHLRESYKKDKKNWEVLHKKVRQFSLPS